MKCEQVVRRMLCASALAMFAGGCASMAAEPAQVPAMGIEQLPNAIDPGLYQAEIGHYRLDELQRKQRDDGYTVESGSLREAKGAGGIAGSLVVVRSPLNEVTAIVDRPGKRGLLLVDKAGERRFLEEPAYDYLRADALPGAQEGVSESDVISSAGHEIDALMAFSTKALDVLGSDPVAFALAQLETVNLGLRNSQVRGVKVNLAGIVVTQTDHGVDGSGLEATRAFMEPLRAAYRHDINAAYYDESPYAGMAWRPGNTSVNGIHYPMAFRHELGHNVGGGHCHPDAGHNYKHGHQTMRGAHTHLCGNNVPYYSTPWAKLNDEPLGNASTADMARLWREQASRLSGYSPAFPGERMIFASPRTEARLDIMTLPTSSRSGIVALTTEVGPVQLSGAAGSHTQLQVPLKHTDGRTFTVNLRAQSQIGDCARRIMNSSQGCHPDMWRGGVSLILNYDIEQNRHLPKGWYNGVLELKALDPTAPDWSRPILVSLSLQR
ncbi:hypothetical protein PS627_03510 [Pseudomonas fluorescens]|uniref:hypothetical protein n=1 Tax=Pseudomonas fluorescens TaxID=294 RepID=UPI00125AE4C2|nr:hypothetical protein [Pseudomonas fluorescens]CAG8869437.1 hypothetical protein PS627_03510 [Pseudomonas fluorescens]VVP95059.1 hypothetical protein PS910_03258 [Pseudomonas fluorescens]